MSINLHYARKKKGGLIIKHRMGKKVKILSSLKINGTYNHGKIIGVEKIEEKIYLGYKNEAEYLSRFTGTRYKVAYIDCVTDIATYNWFHEDDLE